MAGNLLASIASTSGQQLDAYVADNVRPFISRYSLDMTLGLLTIVFSESVQTNLNVTSITLQSSSLAAHLSGVTLTGGTVTQTTTRGTAYVFLTSEDILSIKLTAGLARTFASTFMMATKSLAMDIAGNSMVPIVNGTALSCATFISVAIDLDAFSITLLMSDLVLSSSVIASSLSIQSNATYSSLSTFQMASLSSSSGVKSSYVLSHPFVASIVVTVSARDMNLLKSLYPLLSGPNTSYISVTASFLTDVYLNPVVPVLSSAALYPISWRGDSVKPLLILYYLDMSLLTIFLRFKESMALNSLTTSQLGMQSTPKKKYGKAFRISTASVVAGTGYNATDLAIYLSPLDVKIMKFNSIGTASDTANLIWGSTLMSDNAGNFLFPGLDGTVKGVTPPVPSSYTPDDIKPVLMRWYLDRTTLFVHLHFTEPVVLLNSSAIILVLASKTVTSTKITVIGSRPLGYILPRYQDYNTHVILPIISNYSTDGYCSAATTTLTGTNLFDLCSLPPQISSAISITSTGLYLSVLTNGAFMDFALIPNLMLSVTNQVEESPDCSPCSSGQYTSTQCTTADDRICSACSTCGEGKYTVDVCEGPGDVTCKICSICPVGTYSSTTCGTEIGSTQDTVCTECSACSALQYERTECIPTADTGCSSCEQCTFTTDALKAICQPLPAYLSWRRAFCCFDNNKNLVDCDQLDIANMIISSRNSRHTWALGDATSPVDPLASSFRLGNTF
jgi:hypothetical protein